MSVKFVDGDVFATPSNVALAHGCNCAGAMGKGIAVEFKRRWPVMYSLYKTKCNDGEFACGDVLAWEDDATGRIVFNLGTQKTWRTKATLDAIRASLEKTVALAEEARVKAVCMPMIGAGLGGLDVALVKQLIVDVVGESSVLFVVCENYSKGIAPLSVE
ncbi:MAG: macro domain-containing protein [Planctomycetaceae bacterium]